MLWHRQAIFESKGDKLSSSAEGRIRTQDLRYLFTSRLNACWQTDWAIEDQAKNLNSTARPYDQQAFSPLDLIANWLSHLALAIYIFVVVNFDALAQASDIRIERRQVVFLCWRQDSNPRHTYIHTCLWLLISMLLHRQAIFESKGDKLFSSAECRIPTQRVSGTESPVDWMSADKPTELSRIKLKLELDSPSLWSVSIQSTPPHCGFRIERRQVVADRMPTHKPTELSRIK